MTPDRRTLLALFSLAFGLRLLFAAVMSANPEVLPVRETYDFRVAARMAQDFSWLTTPFSPNAPGYLILLATAFKLAGASWWTAVLLNAILGASTTFFVYRLGERQLGRHVGLWAALWLAVSARPMISASLAIRDVTTTFLFVWFVYALIRPFHRMRVALWQAFLYTLLVCTEPLFLWLLPLVLIYLGRWSTHHRDMSVRYLFLFALTLVVINIPWTVRNYVVHRDFVPVSLEASRYTAPLEHLLRPAPPAPAMRASNEIVHAPGFVHNTREFWRVVRLRPAPADPAHGLPEQKAWSLRHNAVSLVNYGVLLPFFAAGAVMAWRRRHRVPLALTCGILGYAIVRGVIGGDDRTRMVVDPLIILVAMYAVRRLLDLRHAAGRDDVPAI